MPNSKVKIGYVLTSVSSHCLILNQCLKYDKE